MVFIGVPSLFELFVFDIQILLGLSDFCFTSVLLHEVLFVVVIVNLGESLPLVNRGEHHLKLFVLLVLVCLVQFAVRPFVYSFISFNYL